MKTIYVYSNELLGDNGADFNDESCVDIISCDTEMQCVEKFNADYCSNDYSYSFARHQ